MGFCGLRERVPIHAIRWATSLVPMQFAGKCLGGVGSHVGWFICKGNSVEISLAAETCFSGVTQRNCNCSCRKDGKFLHYFLGEAM